MSAIAPPAKDLVDRIDRDLYRRKLGEMSDSFQEMDRYITNIQSDLDAIQSLIEDLAQQRQMGYDVGSAETTLLFQLSQLSVDLNWFKSQKKEYLNKAYGDLFKFAMDIAENAAQIEPRRNGETVQDLVDRKVRGMRPVEEGAVYSMADVQSLLSNTERLLMELASDVASIDPRIETARQREARGFQIGNLLVNLTSQRAKLTTDFQSSCARIDSFLSLNAKFAGRCLHRIKMIADEIVSEQEMKDKKEAEVEGDPAEDAAEDAAEDPAEGSA